MPVSVTFIKELEGLDPKLRRVLISMLEELERQREESVTKKELNELTDIVRDLGKAVRELAEAQKKTEARVEELAQAQKRTEDEIAKLVRRMDIFEERLEGISNSVGYSLENISYRALPTLLNRRYGLQVEGRLVRRYVLLGRKEIQVNIYGHAKKNGKRFIILGECKVRTSKKEVERFERYAKRISDEEGAEAFLLLWPMTSIQLWKVFSKKKA